MKRRSVKWKVLLVVMLLITAVSQQAESGRADWKVWEGKLNINEASEAELMLLDGVGKVTAYRIVEYRDKMGGFKSIAQLKEVKGISKEKLKSLEDHLTLFEKSDLRVLVDINMAPVSALKALPRVSKKVAIAIVEHRERNDGFKDVAELLQIPGIDRAKLDELGDFVTVRPLETIAGKTP